MLRTDRTERKSFLQSLLEQRLLVLALAIAIGAVASWRTVRTYQSLRSDLEELLPTSAPSVTSIAVLRERVPGLRYLGVVIDTGGPQNLAAAEHFVEALALRVRAYPRDEVAAVRGDIVQERRFAETYALQLIPPEEVRELREALEEQRDREVSRGLGIDLLEDEERAEGAASGARESARKLRDKYQKRYDGPRYPGDRFVSEDGHTRVLLIQAGSHATGYDSDRSLIERVKSDIDALGFPAAYAPGMRVGFAGDVATRVEEMAGLATDLGISGAVVITLVVSVIVMFFGSWRALPILGIPLAIGTVLAFAFVALPPLSIRHLNSNTAFLASIIIGNGVNFGIILLARFVEQRARGEALIPAIRTAVSGTWIATLAAALAASAAYGCLVFTDFRGFNQFGWIGGIGMLTCWAATYLITPPLLTWLGARMVPLAGPATQTHAKSFSERVLGHVLSWPRAILALSLIALIVSTIGILKRHGDYLEYDLSKLRRRDSWISGERYWGKRMDATLKRYLTPTLIMADTPDQARTIETRVRELARQSRAGGLIGNVMSGATLLPHDRAQSITEAQKLKNVLTPRMKSQLEPDDRKLVERALSPAAFKMLSPADLPDVLVSGLREKSGRMDRNVLVYPKLGVGTWDAQRMSLFASDLRQAATVNGEGAPIAGSLLLSSDIANAMHADGPRATLLALVMVVAVCMFAFRSVGLSCAAIGSLLAGVLLMLGAMSWMGARLNFSNFVALPITLGIGADYSINVLKRYQTEGSTSIERALSKTGGAVVLCSATTIIGYGSLLVAQNRALFSFGVLAVAGEIACLGTAVLVLPAVLKALSQRKSEAARSEMSSHTSDPKEPSAAQ